MKKDKKFLKDLEENLVDVTESDKKAILEKYENIIKTEKENKKKITVIIKELGDPKEIALKEKELLGKESFFDKFKKTINNKIKEYKEKKKEKDESIDKKLKNNRDELKKKLKDEKKKLNKDLKEEKKKIKKEIEEEKEKAKKKGKDTEEKGISRIITFFTKERSFKKKEEDNKLIETINPKDIESGPVAEVVEDIKDEINDVAEIVAEKRIFESRGVRVRRALLRTLGVIITTILLFIWLWITVVFIASIFAYLDGVKFPGINIALFGLVLLVLWIVIMINRAIFKKNNRLVLNLIVVIVSIILIALGTVMALKQISEIKTVKDVSVKYSMTTKLNTYQLSSDKSQKFTITFNSNYDTQYTMAYDKTLKNKFKVEIKYYECYYDYYIKETSNSAYISLKLDNRDRLSVYIDDLKEGMVLDNDELSRYSVKITVNPNDAGRLVILN